MKNNIKQVMTNLLNASFLLLPMNWSCVQIFILFQFIISIIYISVLSVANIFVINFEIFQPILAKRQKKISIQIQIGQFSMNLMDPKKLFLSKRESNKSKVSDPITEFSNINVTKQETLNSKPNRYVLYTFIFFIGMFF